MEVKKIDKDLDFLRQVCNEVDFSKSLIEEIAELEKYVLERKCFALAANQLGYDNRIVYVRCSDYNKFDDPTYNEAIILINPVITDCEGLTTYWEACVSCMDNTAIICRPYKAHITYYDIHGNINEMTISGFPLTILSHEFDHLDGILHMDKALEILQMDKDVRREFRKKYGYEVYEKDGDFSSLCSEYEYDNKSKKLIKC